MLESGPAEKDNDGCFFLKEALEPRPAEAISVNIPAFLTEPKVLYEKQEFTPENAAAIPCEQVLGAYKVIFERVE